MKSTRISVENGDVLGSLRKFLGELLEHGLVDAVLVPKMLPSQDGFVQSLVKDALMLEDANPLAPTMAVQSARILSELTSSPSDRRIGAVLKPCELRAAVEMAKFLQIDLEHVVTIGVDCLGTYQVRDFAEMVQKDQGLLWQVLVDEPKGGVSEPGNGYSLRECCQICEYPVPVHADLAFGFLGVNPSKEILLTVGERFEKDLTEKLSLELQEGNPAEREKAVGDVIEKRKRNRAKVLDELKGQADSLERLMGVLSSCIRCRNCMKVCPICYCKECVFESPVFEHRADEFLGWADRKGAVRMPSDTLMFHLTRMSHMATSCVGCGMCDSACPSQLPISSLFGLVAGELQEMFEYVPGRDPEEEPPVSAFKEDELQAETGTH